MITEVISMARTTANISIDPEVKAKAQALFAEFGMDLSTAVNIFLRQAIRENAIPFAITKDVANEETKKAIENVRQGKNLSRGFSSVAELMEDLYADD